MVSFISYNLLQHVARERFNHIFCVAVPYFQFLDLAEIIYLPQIQSDMSAIKMSKSVRFSNCQRFSNTISRTIDHSIPFSLYHSV